MTTETPEVPEAEVEITDPAQIPAADAWTREDEPEPDTLDQSPVDLGAKVNDQ